MTGRHLIVLWTTVLVALAPLHLSSQVPVNVGGKSEVFAGSVLESYLRYMQSMGKAPTYPVSVRGFSLRELDAIAIRDSVHPWVSRYSLNVDPPVKRSWDYVRPAVDFTLNTSFPYGNNDGPVWKGKGLTSVVSAGLSARWGALSVLLAPVLFRAENSAFPLMDNRDSVRLEFADGRFPRIIDRPQRFGSTSYQRVDPGESSIRFDAGGVTAAISTASEWWGPTNDFPFTLGNNAGGFPHVIFGTSGPANVGIGKLHGRLIYGLLEQSAFSPVTGPEFQSDSLNRGTRRFATGLVAVLQVRGAPGLEIGGSRFYHVAYKRGGPTAQRFGLPFQQLLKNRVATAVDSALGSSPDGGENQLASVFFRWSPPGSGFDLYGEYGRDDHAADIRDLLLEPDHTAALSFGFRQAWLSPAGLTAVRAEVFQYGGGHSSTDRFEGFMYTHAFLRQGHTSRGQVLGADIGAGSGGAQILAVDRFSPKGRSTAYFRRATQREAIPVLIDPQPEAARNPVDVMNTLGADVGRFIGKVDITLHAALTFNLNRYYLSDQTNVSIGIAARQSF